MKNRWPVKLRRVPSCTGKILGINTHGNVHVRWHNGAAGWYFPEDLIF